AAPDEVVGAFGPFRVPLSTRCFVPGGRHDWLRGTDRRCGEGGGRGQGRGRRSVRPVAVVTGLGARRLRLELGRAGPVDDGRGLPDWSGTVHHPGTAVITVGPLSVEGRAALDAAAIMPIAIETPDELRVDAVRLVSYPDVTVEARSRPPRCARLVRTGCRGRR